MTAHLPPSLLALFAPRPPIPYMPPVAKKNLPPYLGIASLTQFFEDPNVTPYLGEEMHPFETKQERKKRKLKERSKKRQEEVEELVKQWDPHKDQKATSDPYKTLSVSKINYNTSEHKLKREFEMYGPIKKVRIIQDQEGKPRGYAFIEYEKERDMRNAYKQADGKKIDSKRVLVDVERGRTVRGWRPRRFGGGAGHSRGSSEERRSGRESQSSRGEYRERSRDKDRDRDRDRHRHSHREHSPKDREGNPRERSGDEDKAREKESHRHHF